MQNIFPALFLSGYSSEGENLTDRGYLKFCASRMISPVDANEIFVATFTKCAGINYTVSVRLAGPEDALLPMAFALVPAAWALTPIAVA